MLRLAVHPDGMGRRVENLPELHLEAFLPADEATADILRRRAQRATDP